MKSKILITGAILCAITTTGAHAVTKCVRLRSSTTCFGGSGAENQSNWSASCNGAQIQGVAFCGSQKGESAGAKLTAVPISSTVSDNKHCWCKMVSPVVSPWVFGVQWFTTAGNCATGCADNCVYALTESSVFRAGLFSEFSD